MIVETLAPLHWLHVPDHAPLNRILAEQFNALRDAPEIRRSHFFFGRYENLYIEREQMPQMQPLIAAAEQAAVEILRPDGPLRCGFWFNSMQPGQRTSAHTHDENDELLSAVYYVTAPENSGDLLLLDAPATVRIRPEPGMMVLFPPDLEHEVETNQSDQQRLSIAFNFGPA